ncbi:MAG: hypothetical protein WEB06_15100 [Actinomycetota bacterium]
MGATYVLFLAEDLGGGRFKTRSTSAAHLLLVDGVVYSLFDVDPRSGSEFSIRMKPEPLESFVARFA